MAFSRDQESKKTKLRKTDNLNALFRQTLRAWLFGISVIATICFIAVFFLTLDTFGSYDKSTANYTVGLHPFTVNNKDARTMSLDHFSVIELHAT